MKTKLFTLFAVLLLATTASAQLDDILKKADETLNHRDTSNLSTDKIISGLKEALQVSTTKAVALTGRPNGFLKNEAIKIALPPKLGPVSSGMRMLGMGAEIDDLEVGMNHAAEQATPQAKLIFLTALKRCPSTTHATSSPATTPQPPTTSNVSAPPT